MLFRERIIRSISANRAHSVFRAANYHHKRIVGSRFNFDVVLIDRETQGINHITCRITDVIVIGFVLTFWTMHWNIFTLSILGNKTASRLQCRLPKSLFNGKMARNAFTTFAGNILLCEVWLSTFFVGTLTKMSYLPSIRRCFRRHFADIAACIHFAICYYL